MDVFSRIPPTSALRRRTQPFHWREASLCVPAMPLLLVAGFASGDIAHGAVAAGAAFSVGFGASRDLRGRRWGAMIASALGIGVAAFATTRAPETGEHDHEPKILFRFGRLPAPLTDGD